MIRMSGKEVAAQRQSGLKQRIKAFRGRYGRTPGLAVVLIGEDPASQVYVKNKHKACEVVGITSWVHRQPAELTSEALKQLIDGLNADPAVDGILVQLPIPAHLNKEQVLSWINPEKDPDALTVMNMGLMWAGKTRVAPCTPSGVMKILEHYKISVAGKKAVVVGRSEIVGKPMSLLLQEADATVTVCHSKTPSLREYTQKADIVVVAVGKACFLGREDFKQGSVIVDVGIHRLNEVNGAASLCGDVRYKELEDWCLAVTPVPGGVGPMTIHMLLENTVTLAEQRAI